MAFTSWILIVSTYIANLHIIDATWILSDTALSTAGDDQAVGAYNDTIFLLGGTYPKQRTEYRVRTQTLIEYGAFALSHDVIGYAQYWTQQENIMYLIADATNSITTYNMITRQLTTNWNAITIPIVVSDKGCVTSSEGYLHFTGGHTESNVIHNYLQILRLSTLQWVSNPPNMQQARHKHSCIAHNNFVWAFGGTQAMFGGVPMTSNERIDITDIATLSQQTWDVIDPLSVALRYTRAVALEDTIFIVGGFDGNKLRRNFIHLVDAYSGAVTVADGSDQVDELPLVNAWGAPVIYNNVLYVFGGFVSNRWAYYTLSSQNPTSHPSISPANIPSNNPIANPTVWPSNKPTNTPTFIPSSTPTKLPSSSSPTYRIHAGNNNPSSPITTTESVHSAERTENKEGEPSEEKSDADDGNKSASKPVDSYVILIVSAVVLSVFMVGILFYCVSKKHENTETTQVEKAVVENVINEHIENKNVPNMIGIQQPVPVQHNIERPLLTGGQIATMPEQCISYPNVDPNDVPYDANDMKSVNATREGRISTKLDNVAMAALPQTNHGQTKGRQESHDMVKRDNAMAALPETDRGQTKSGPQSAEILRENDAMATLPQTNRGQTKGAPAPDVLNANDANVIVSKVIKNDFIVVGDDETAEENIAGGGTTGNDEYDEQMIAAMPTIYI